MKKKCKDGIITPFAAVSIVLVVSLILVLLEGTRVRYGEKLCAQQAQYAAQTFLGQYNITLLEKFDIYGVDERMYEKKDQFLTDVGAFRTGPTGGAFLNPKSNVLKGFAYRLLTDDGGADFRKQAISSYLYRLSEEGIERLKGHMALVSGLGNEQTEEDILRAANEAMKEAKRLKEEGNNAHGSCEFNGDRTDVICSNVLKKSKEGVENPIEEMKKQKASFTLSVVLPEEFSISDAAKSQNSRLEDRLIESGSMDADKTSIVNEKLLFPLYLADTFQHALSDREKAKAGGLQYQMEYFVIGKDSDIENLNGVVHQLILMREMTWFVSRLSDGKSMPAARSIATILACGLAMPVLIEPIATAIVLAWAYTDAIQDVKALLAGKEIPLIPTESAQESRKYLSGGKSEWMLSYADYLLVLVAMKNTDTVTFRALDMVQERLLLDGCDFVPEKIVTGIEGTMVYTYEELFLEWVTIGGPAVFPIQIESDFCESYCP